MCQKLIWFADKRQQEINRKIDTEIILMILHLVSSAQAIPQPRQGYLLKWSILLLFSLYQFDRRECKCTKHEGSPDFLFFLRKWRGLLRKATFNNLELYFNYIMVETVWTSLLENPKFIREIKEKGFSKERKFIDYVNKNNLSVFHYQ